MSAQPNPHASPWERLVAGERSSAEYAVQDWRNNAACLTYPNLPWTHDTPSTADKRIMALVCATCPVFNACSAEASRVYANVGFWAGHNRTIPSRDAAQFGRPWNNPPTDPPAWAQPTGAEQLDLGLDLGGDAA